MLPPRSTARKRREHPVAAERSLPASTEAGILTLNRHDTTPADLVRAKRGRRVSVCLPARDEESTIAPIVGSLRRELSGDEPLVDEVLVVDDGSRDGTADAASRAGARVVRLEPVGKGRAMWTGVREARGDLVVFCDADLHAFECSFVVRLLAPLLSGDAIGFVKGFYQRPWNGQPGEGGRVTELVAKPLLRTLFPELASLHQPLAGECAARRSLLEQVPFVEDYGVDIGLVLDVAERFGKQTIAQVDLGVRTHRNRPLNELAPQAESVVRTVLARAGLAGAVAQCPPLAERKHQPEGLAASV